MRRAKQIFWTVAVAIVFIAGAWFGFKVTHWRQSRSGLHEENTPTLVQQIQNLSDLITVKYVLEKVVIVNDAKWYGDNRVLLLAHGVVKAGIDLKRLKPDDVAISGQKITLHLPPAQITDTYLDDRRTRVIDWTTGLFRTFNKNLATTARQDAVNDIRRAALKGGILEDANKRARLELALFLHEAGFAQVEFVDKIPASPTNQDVPKI